MAKFQFDIAPEDENGDFYVSPGCYLAECVEADEGLTKERDPKIKFTFQILRPEAQEGKKIFRDCALTKKSAGFTVPVLKALGVERTGEGYDFETEDFIGRMVVVVVEDREYQGQVRSDCKKVLPESAWES